MPLTLAGVSVPDLGYVNTALPIKPEYPFVDERAPEVVVHRFGSANALIEQRFYLGDGLRRFTVNATELSFADRDALLTFWELTNGGLSTFDLTVPLPDGTTEAIRVRFEHQQITVDALAGGIMSANGVTLVAVPTSTPTYSLTATLQRFPSSGFATTLLGQTHTIIPLLKMVTATGSQTMYLADRGCTIAGTFYHPRLLDWGPIEQQMNGGSDRTTFVLGNADRVFSAIANLYQLRESHVEFSLFHVESQTKIDLWAGQIRSTHRGAGPTMTVEADEGLPLLVSYPDVNSRACWKLFGGPDCRWTSGTSTSRSLTKSDGTLVQLTFTPSTATCDHSYEGANGCLAHLNEVNYGALPAQPQTVRTRDNSTGVMGFGRSDMTSSSQIADSVYTQVLPDLYVNCTNANMAKGYPLKAMIVAGRDEGDFYTALGVVCRGPIDAYAAAIYNPADPTSVVPFMLDNQPWHGVNRNTFGLRLSVGADPVQNHDGGGPSVFNDSDKFSLGEGGSGPQRYGYERAAGVAFCEIRRTDEKGLQLSRPDQHDMEVNVRRGLGGWQWASGARLWVSPMTNPVFVTINTFLRAIGMRAASSDEQIARFDLASAEAIAWDVCQASVAAIIGVGDETQFVFNGILRENKPLKDWLVELCNNFLGYFVWSFGKLRLGCRFNSSAASAFTTGNIIFSSLDFPPTESSFNKVIAEIADEEFDYVLIPVTASDFDAATEAGGGLKQEWRETRMSLVGTASKSQAARIVTTRLREETGGITAAQRRALTNFSLKTTVLALDTEAGTVISITHPDCPDYPAKSNGSGARATYVEGRIQRWRLNKDFSIDIEGRSTHDDMYDLVAGPKPDDVNPEIPPGDELFAPANWRCEAVGEDGKLRLRNFACGSNSAAVRTGRFDIYYIDEATCTYGTVVGGLADDTTGVFLYSGIPPTEGEWILVGDEVMQVEAVEPGDPNFGYVTVTRGWLGTVAAAHPRIIQSITAVNAGWSADLNVGSAGFVEGSSLVLNDGTTPAPQSIVMRSDRNVGAMQTALPISGIAVGKEVYQDPRLWRVTRASVIIPFPANFFRSPQRAEFEEVLDLPNSGIVLIQGLLENTRGIQSDPLTLFPTSAHGLSPQTAPYHPAWPYRVRTLGEAKILLSAEQLPDGVTDNAFLSVPATDAQAFQWALATLTAGAANPVDTPSAVPTVIVTQLDSTGNIVIGGTINASGQIQISISGANSLLAPTFVIGDYSPALTTATAVVTKLAAWLNADPHFFSYYTAIANGTTLKIRDGSSLGGTVLAKVNGAGVTATATGFTSVLGINYGRRYAIAYTDATHRSDLSAVSDSTGPTGDAQRIEIHDIPASSDSRVTTVEVYALPDGQTSGTYRLVGTVPNGTGYFADSNTEAALASLTAYPGLSQPTAAGPTTVTVKKNGLDWFQLYIPANTNISNWPDGFGMDPIAADTEINACINNGAGDGASLLIELQ